MSDSIKRLAFTAILVALSVVTNVFTVFLPGGISVSFTYIPIFFAGVFLGPWTGFAVGVTGDLLGCLLHPMGPWIPLITLSSGLIGLVPGLLFAIPAGKLMNNKKWETYLKICAAMLLVFVVCTAGVNTFGLWLTYSAGKKTFWVYLLGRLPAQSLAIGTNLALIYLVYPVLHKIMDRAFKKSGQNQKTGV